MDLGNGWAAVLRNKYTPNEGPVALPPDGVFVLNLLRLMEDCGTDYTDTWRALSGVPALSVAGDGDNVPGLRLRSGEELVSSVGSNKMRAAGPDLDISEDGQRECGSLMSEDVEICDNECLQPMSAILADAKASRDQMRQWAQWIRQYMVRIDEMVSLCSRRLRQTERSTASWKLRQGRASMLCTNRGLPSRVVHSQTLQVHNMGLRFVCTAELSPTLVLFHSWSHSMYVSPPRLILANLSYVRHS